MEKRNPFRIQPKHIHNPSGLWRLGLIVTELKYLGEPSNTQHAENSSRPLSNKNYLPKTMEQIVAVQSQGQKHVGPIYQYTALWQQHTNSALESELKLSHMKDLVPVFSGLEKIHFFHESGKSRK